MVAMLSSNAAEGTPSLGRVTAGTVADTCLRQRSNRRTRSLSRGEEGQTVGETGEDRMKMVQ